MKIKKYIARQGSPFKKEEAQKIGEFIYNIEEKTPENILNEIKKNKKHIIAKYIEWDDKIAGNNYRLQQVRNIVNHIEVEIVNLGERKIIRGFYSIINERNSLENEDVPRSEYVDVVTSFEDEYSRQQIIKRAKVELRNWNERYKIYEELNKIVNLIENYLNE